MVKEISREELKAKMDQGDDFVLVEALSRGHFESSHLPGAINLPYEFVDEAERVLPDKRAEIVIYCTSCTTREASRAGSRLASLWKAGRTARDAEDAGGVGAWAYWRGGARVRRGEALCERAPGPDKSVT